MASCVPHVVSNPLSDFTSALTHVLMEYFGFCHHAALNLTTASCPTAVGVNTVALALNHPVGKSSTRGCNQKILTLKNDLNPTKHCLITFHFIDL